jgi:spore germination cell wall hydrolase CwlJ-like protein
MLMITALACLTANIYFEARGETIIGQNAVAQVTMNRAGRNPSNVCKVVIKSKQFSWTNDAVGSIYGVAYIKSAYTPKDIKALRQAEKVASLVLRGQLQDFTGGATHYHTKVVHPYWDKVMKMVMVVGHHEFYIFKHNSKSHVTLEAMR